MEQESIITASGQVLSWCREIREALEQEEPDAGIPFEVCDCPPIAEYKAIIGAVA